MSEIDPVLDSTARQQRASDPRVSAWVSASAGTGKTRVLTDRVLRLLLHPDQAGGEIAPSRLLCLTFTNAAAAEMSNRLAARLARWATMPDAELATQLAQLQGQEPDEDMMARARRLFARVLDAPGGLAIVTLHGFCQSLLRRFPLEAGVAPHFQVMDERDARELMDEAREEVLAVAGDDLLLRPALSKVAGGSADRFAALVGALASERGRLARLAEHHGGPGGVIAEMHRRRGVRNGETEASHLAAACADAAFEDVAALRSACAALAQGGKTDIDRAARMHPFLGDPAGRMARFDEWCRCFFTGKGEFFASYATKGVEAASPGIGARLAREAERLAMVIERRHTLAICEATSALLTLGYAVLDAYQARKRRRALLDYDDLVLHARRLLEAEGGAAWALYKLDGGIDHVLIDEAQDTNPDQWAVVRALTAEFFAGAGRADEWTRSLFAVGDGKQSIFSFQRADPAAFTGTRDALTALAGENRLVRVPLTTSFRSAAPVLDAVDMVFNTAEARDGVLEGDERSFHRVARQGAAGRVELWPAIEPRPPDPVEAWTPPVTRVAGDSPSRRMARLVARRIAAMIGTEELASKGRPVRAGDVLVLVRRRGDFVGHLVRELKGAAVPVAGADRMVLTGQMAVMDLMALGAVLLLPEDDLTLATVLKGPLIGLSEDELMELAAERPQGSRLWTELSRRREPVYVRARDELGRLLAMADLLPPHDLFAHVLVRGGKARLLARLGAEAEDPIDEFMALALAYERLHSPSLQGFLHWLQSGGDEIKRDFEGGGDMVRIMTVHGAKGLQAPVVIVPDTFSAPTDTPSLLWDDVADDEMPVWLPYSDMADPPTLVLRQAAQGRRDAEYRRLLYVALTRAEDVLIVAGWKTRRPAPAGCWYHLVHAALDGSPLVRREDSAFLGAEGETVASEMLVLSTPQTAPVTADAGGALAAGVEPLPAWARDVAPVEPVPSRPLAPSRPDEDEPAALSPLASERDRRFKRGLLIHRLLQTLPDLAPEARRGTAERYLARRGIEEGTAVALADEVLAVLADAAFAPLFGPGSRAEVPLTGLVGSRAVSGVVDRLVILPGEVLVIDYKSNRPPPQEVADVPGYYLRQMAIYRALLGRIWPDRPVRCALLWTDGPRLMELPAVLLDRAAAGLAAA